jgi:hypothetical protein
MRTSTHARDGGDNERLRLRQIEHLARNLGRRHSGHQRRPAAGANPGIVIDHDVGHPHLTQGLTWMSFVAAARPARALPQSS